MSNMQKMHSALDPEALSELQAAKKPCPSTSCENGKWDSGAALVDCELCNGSGSVPEFEALFKVTRCDSAFCDKEHHLAKQPHEVNASDLLRVLEVLNQRIALYYHPETKWEVLSADWGTVSDMEFFASAETPEAALLSAAVKALRARGENKEAK